MATHYTVLTHTGVAKIADAIRTGTRVEITSLAVGDGAGKLPAPSANTTRLVNEQHRAPINLSFIDENNTAWVVFEQVLPPEVGGWWIREVGLFDAAGDLIAVGNYPKQYKPLLDEGASTTQTVRVVILVSDTNAVTLKIDPSVVLATRQYVDRADTQLRTDLQQHIEEGDQRQRDALDKATKALGQQLSDLPDGARLKVAPGIDVDGLQGQPDYAATTQQLVQLRGRVNTGASMRKPTRSNVWDVAGTSDEIASTELLVHLRNTFVQDLRWVKIFESPMRGYTTYGVHEGEVISEIKITGQVEGDNDYIVVRVLQKLVGGQWYTVTRAS